MVASKLNVPVYLVLDPNEVPDYVRTPGGSAGQAKPIEVYQLRHFVGRDLFVLLQHYFANVQLVGSDPPPSGQPVVVVRVRITGLTTQVDQAAAAGGAYAFRVYGVMDWSLGFRFAGERDFFYSFSDRAVGGHGLVTIDESSAMFKSTFEAALIRFIRDFEHKQVRKWIGDRLSSGT
jgi:hypothetical protein